MRAPEPVQMFRQAGLGIGIRSAVQAAARDGFPAQGIEFGGTILGEEYAGLDDAAFGQISPPRGR